jgi:membrane-bound ClpP family serine protease
MTKKILLLVWLSCFALSLLAGQVAYAQTSTPQIVVLNADGPVTPAMAQ